MMKEKTEQLRQSFIEKAYQKRLLLLEFGIGFNTPAIIRFPFERMAAKSPHRRNAG